MDTIALIGTDKIDDDLMSIPYADVGICDRIVSSEWLYVEKGCKRCLLCTVSGAVVRIPVE